MKKEMKVWAMTCIAFWWLAPNQTYAQQDSTQTTRLNEVVITATKFPKSLAETGKDLTVISNEQLRQQAGKDLAQVLNEQAGVVVNGANSNPGKDKSIYLRGAKTEHTLVLIDGIPITDPSGVGGAFDLRLLPLDQIESIEILKGSQSTLYGTDAIAGVINIITKKAGDKPLTGSGALAYGSFNTISGQASLAGKTRWVDYRAGYTRLQTNGISEASEKMGGANFDKDGFDQNAWQANVTFTPSADFSVRPFVRYSTFDGKFDAGAFADDPNATFNTKLVNTGAIANYEFKRGRLQMQYAYDRTQRDYMTQFGSFEYDGRFGQGEFFGQYNFGSFVQALGGLSLQRFKMIGTSAAAGNPSTEIVSPFLSVFIRRWHGLSVELGGRLAGHSAYGEVVTYSVNPSYWINKKAKLFTNFSTGFKAPTLNQLYGPFGANEGLQPEKSKSFDAGAQYLLNDDVDLKAVFFSRRVNNGIAYINNYLNVDAQNDNGLELEVRYRAGKKISATAFFAYVDGEVATKTFTGTDTTFNNLFRRPKHSWGLTLSVKPTSKFSADLLLKSFGARDDLFFDLSTFNTSIVRLKAYQLLDVHLNYAFSEQFSGYIDLRNLLNADYQEAYGFNTQPVNFTTGLAFHF